jgi:pilus assembly protein CpaE
MSNDDGQEIKILLVDDVAEAREGVKKLLAFEQDFKVVGAAANGRDGVKMAKELHPDIVIMDINMPDMDGLEAAGLITKALPTVGVIMMSVQDDSDYMQKAMLAGARFFLPKPPNMDQLYSTIRSVYTQYEPIRRQMAMIAERGAIPMIEEETDRMGDRAGHVIVVYSPQGGSGKTTIATNLASGLMKEGIKTLLIDGDLQYGDVGAFLDLRSPSTVLDLIENVDDMDIDLFENIVLTHNSGVKVLLSPPRPTDAFDIRDNSPEAIATLINNIAGFYDFVVVDASSMIDTVTAQFFDIAAKIVLVVTPTLPSIKNVRLVLDMFDQNEFPAERTALVINKMPEDPKRARGLPTPEKIQSYLRRPIEGVIPAVDERFILSAVNKGVPVIASDRDTNKAPIKQLLQLSDHIYHSLMGGDEEDTTAGNEEQKEKAGWGRLFGGNR